MVHLRHRVVSTVVALTLATAACSSGDASGDGSRGVAVAGTAAATTTEPAATATTTLPTPPSRSLASGKGMSAVPSGTYTVGATASAESAAARQITLNAFYIDTFEVTNVDYRRFVDAEGALAPRGWVRGRLPEGQETYPVVGVDWEWARAYCVSLLKRLPTDAEWEAAARGPDGRAYPWGNAADAVDLDTPGGRPVGSVAANVSPFGVRDTVGSAWEWVDEPYDPVATGNRVRRGGQYGRVRIGAAFRQAVPSNNESAIAETGFRCAADAVDPSAEPGKFSSEHPRPASPPATQPTATRGDSRGILRDDSFEDPRSGWIDQSDPRVRSSDYFLGYHAPGWYHIEVAKPNTQVMSLAGLNAGDIAIEVSAYVDKTNSTDGRYRYGIVLRADGPSVAAPLGTTGPDRPRDFYAYVIDPRSRVWQLIHSDTLPYRVVAEGPLTVPVRTTDAAHTDSLRVEAVGSTFTMYVNGSVVGTYDTHGYHLTGDIGMFVESLDETKAHVHFDSILVTRM